MTIYEQVANISGRIKFGFVNKDNYIEKIDRSNVITYNGADIMARLLGGDLSYSPKHIGFMYGADPTAASLIDPDLLPDATKRVHPWSKIAQDTADATANILIAPLALSPGYAATSTNYVGNEITVSAFTGVSTEYAFPTTGGIYAPKMEDLPTLYFYQAILLNRRVINAQTVYTTFSRVTLRNPSTGLYDQKPTGFEASLYWLLTFN